MAEGAPLLGKDHEERQGLLRRTYIALFQVKSVDQVMSEVKRENEELENKSKDESTPLLADSGSDDPEKAKNQKKGLKRELKVYDLIGYGVGSTVGAGIYSLVAAAAAKAGNLTFLLLNSHECAVI